MAEESGGASSLARICRSLAALPALSMSKNLPLACGAASCRGGFPADFAAILRFANEPYDRAGALSSPWHVADVNRLTLLSGRHGRERRVGELHLRHRAVLAQPVADRARVA